MTTPPTPEPQATMRVVCEPCDGSGRSASTLDSLCPFCFGDGFASRPDPAATVQRLRALLERVAMREIEHDLNCKIWGDGVFGSSNKRCTCGQWKLVDDIEAELAKANEDPRG